MASNILKKLFSIISLFALSLFSTFFLIEISYQGYLLLIKPVAIYTPESKTLNPGGKGNYRGGFASLDDYGLRNAYDQKALSRKNKFLVIGDSLTFGLGVDDNEVFVHHLNNFSNNSDYSFVNLGHPGYSTSDLIIHYLKYAKRYQNISGVIWVYYINDAYSAKNYLPINIISTHLALANKEHREVTLIEKKVWPYLKSPTLIKHLLLNLSDKYFGNENKNSSWESYYNMCQESYNPSTITAQNEEKFLTDVANHFRQESIPLYFVLAPMLDQFEDNIIWPQFFVKSIMKRHNVPVLDLWEELRKHDDASSYYLPNDHGHWNNLGHQIVAKEIYNFIGLQNEN